jgi:Mg-chelatase subunit ChlD
VPTPAILKTLAGPDGGTDFGPPLEMAEKLMEKYQNDYETFVLVMMSDGFS